MHFYLFDRKTGAPFEGTEELRVTAAMPAKKIAPIEAPPRTTPAPATTSWTGATMSVKGDWTISVVDRVSDFDEYEVKVHGAHRMT